MNWLSSSDICSVTLSKFAIRKLNIYHGSLVLRLICSINIIPKRSRSILPLIIVVSNCIDEDRLIVAIKLAEANLHC